MNKNDILKEIKNISIVTAIILVFMVGSGVLLITKPNREANVFNISDEDINYVKGEGIVIKGKDTVKLYLSGEKRVVELPLEEYIAGVVAAEMPVSFDIEAIKAQAVAARTYYFSKRLSPCKNAEKGEICDMTHCQVYMNKDERKSKWNSETAEQDWEKIIEAVEATKDEVLVYDNSIVEYPLFFSTSWGKTEDASEVFANDIEYLKSKDSPGEEDARKYKSSVEIDISKFVNTLNKAYPNAKLKSTEISSQVTIKSRTDAGAVKEISIGDVSISGIDFRKILNLNSTNFTLEFKNNSVIINCTGYGHGVGMSQYGANAMGKDGKKYDEILKHYYSEVEIEKVKYK